MLGRRECPPTHESLSRGRRVDRPTNEQPPGAGQAHVAALDERAKARQISDFIDIESLGQELERRPSASARAVVAARKPRSQRIPVNGRRGARRRQ